MSGPPEGPTIYDAIGSKAMNAAMGTAQNESAAAGGERPVAGILILFFPTRISQVVASNGPPGTEQHAALSRAAALAVESLRPPAPADDGGSQPIH